MPGRTWPSAPVERTSASEPPSAARWSCRDYGRSTPACPTSPWRARPRSRSTTSCTASTPCRCGGHPKWNTWLAGTAAGLGVAGGEDVAVGAGALAGIGVGSAIDVVHALVGGRPVQGVGAGVALQDVDAGTPLEGVVADTTVEGVIVGLTAQSVVAFAAADGVLSNPALEAVVPGASRHGVVTRTADEHVIADGAGHRVVSAVAVDGVDERRPGQDVVSAVAVDGFGRVGPAAVDGVVGSRSGDGRGVLCHSEADHTVRGGVGARSTAEEPGGQNHDAGQNHVSGTVMRMVGHDVLLPESLEASTFGIAGHPLTALS